MTVKELMDIMRVTVPNIYRGHAPIGSKTPYMIYDVAHPNFGADNKVLAVISSVTAQLYLSKPDTTITDALEDSLSNNDVFWASEEADDPSNGVYTVVYEMEVI